MERFFDWKGIMFGVVIAAGLVLTGSASKMLALIDTPDVFKDALSAIVACTDVENSTVCSRPVVRSMLDMKSGGEILDALALEVSPLQCHYIGHVVGQQSYEKYKNVETAIGQCSRVCDSACVHGVIGESFAQQLGLGPADEVRDIDLRHLTPDEIRAIGKKLCDSPENCHGVGHALFQIYGEFEPALRLCDEVALNESRRYCYQGMFMEYADVLSARNMREVSGVEYPVPETLKSICGQSTFEERRACFKYFPRMAVTTLREGGMSSRGSMNRLREICTEFPREEDQLACVVGIGAYSSYSVVTDPQEGVRTCLRFSRLVDQAACNLGQTSVATQDRQKQVVAYCSAVPRELLRETCFQGIFFYLNLLGTPREESRAICQSDALCLKASERYELDPFAEVRRITS